VSNFDTIQIQCHLKCPRHRPEKICLPPGIAFVRIQPAERLDAVACIGQAILGRAFSGEAQINLLLSPES
jgi:hypothetical protein